MAKFIRYKGSLYTAVDASSLEIENRLRELANKYKYLHNFFKEDGRSSSKVGMSNAHTAYVEITSSSTRDNREVQSLSKALKKDLDSIAKKLGGKSRVDARITAKNSFYEPEEEDEDGDLVGTGEAHRTKLYRLEWKGFIECPK